MDNLQYQPMNSWVIRRIRSSKVRLYQMVLMAGLLSGLVPQAAHAQFGFGGIVFDPKNLAQAVLLYQRVLDQLTVQRQQLTSQIAAMQKLAAPPWRDISAAMTQVDALTRQGQAISYSLQNADAIFRSTFPGTATTGITGGAPIAEQFQAGRTLATLRGAINAAQRAAAEFSTGVARLSDMKRQVATVQGHEQALELNGAVGIYSAEQLTVLSQQLAALTSAQAVYFAHDVNAQAQADANARAFLTQMGAIPSSRPGFSFRVPWYPR